MAVFRHFRLPQHGVAPALTGATGWLNSEPLSSENLHGKVVIYDFWTYTCINWLRSLPYLRAWYAKYRDQGLVVIGVHTPEFAFEHDIDNVRRAAASQRVVYPVVLDSDYQIWRAFDNHYWPAVQELLRDSGAVDVASGATSVTGTGAEAPADWDALESAETYLGYGRSEGFASADLLRDRLHDYELPSVLPRNSWALAGGWTIQLDRIAADRPGASLVTDFHARDLHLVMAPGTAGGPVRMRVSLDGDAPGGAHGLDVDAAGLGVVGESRMYQLVRQPHPITNRTAEISFPDGGAEAFVITFG